jgi:hypothetical protein
MLGVTQKEIDDFFEEYNQIASEKLSLSRAQFDEQLKFWYDGYSWDTENFLYNPFSILNFFDSYRFENYWFSTGTPTFLVNFIREKGLDITDLEEYPVTQSFFDKFDIKKIDIISLLFQTGYLTMKRRDKYGFTMLSYPNEEVRGAFSDNLLESYAHQEQSEISKAMRSMMIALEECDVETFRKEINTLFASIPHQIFIAKKEAYYHSIIYLILKLLGVYIETEVSTSRGRLDAVIKTKEFLYVIEFKMLPVTAEEALAQIKQKGYAEPYKTDSRQKFMIGISFDPEKREIGEMKIEGF